MKFLPFVFVLVLFLFFFFFFSSRRRHTRLVSDWSSDVCSSDLGALRMGRRAGPLAVVRSGLHPRALPDLRLPDGQPDRKSVV